MEEFPQEPRPPSLHCRAQEPLPGFSLICELVFPRLPELQVPIPAALPCQNKNS